MKDKKRAALQILGTLIILGWIPGNLLKLALLILVWILTWGPLRRGFLVLFTLCIFLFTAMDALAVRRGVFVFSRPDIGGLPLWEPLMWAFFTYHFHHMIQGPPPKFDLRVLPMAVLFSACFGLFQTPHILLIATGTTLALSLLLFHETYDVIYTGYAVLVGTAVEFVGVARGLWHYPDAPVGGVPFWYIPLWGSIGLYMRRMGLPLAERISP